MSVADRGQKGERIRTMAEMRAELASLPSPPDEFVISEAELLVMMGELWFGGVKVRVSREGCK